MSWLLNKVTGGLLGSSGSTAQPAQQPDSKYEDEEEEEDSSEQQQPAASSPAVDVDSPQDYSQLTFDEEELCRASITFSRYLSPSEPLVVKSNHALLVILRTPNTYDSTLYVYTSPSRPSIIQPITGALWYDVVKRDQALLFGVVQAGAMHVFHCRFQEAEDAKVAALQLSVAVWEFAQQDSFKKSVKDTLWVDPLQDAYHEPAASYKPSPDDDADFMDTDEKEQDEDDEEAEVQARHATPIRGFKTTRPRTMKTPTSVSGANDKLAVGILNARAFVGRGDAIGVFKHDAAGKLDFMTSIGDIKGAAGHTLKPTQMMLHDNDSKMVLLDASEPSKVYEMDIERGKIVQEYTAMDGDDFKVRSVGHTSKYAEATGEQTILGVNKNSVFSLDPRQHGAKLAQNYTYKSPMDMSTVVANGSGCVATGSGKGEIRLYNDIGKQAKTRLPGLGDEIIGLDTTEDGKWLLATTRYYVLLLSTAIPGDAKDGWSKSMTSSARPPIKLQLSAVDLQKYNANNISFTTAHFNTGDNIEEEWIITSVGPHIVTWNFRRIKADPDKWKYAYNIKKLATNVVADQFLYGHKDAVVVTTANNVFTERKGKI